MWIVNQITARTPKSGWRGYVLIGCVAVLALLLAGASWSAWQSSIERKAADERQHRTLEVLRATDRLRAAALQQVRGGRGYLLTGNRVFLSPRTEGLRDAEEAIDRLVALISDNPDQLPRISALQTDLRHLEVVIGSMIESTRTGRTDDALTLMRSGNDRDAIEAILRTLDEIETEERAALSSRTAIAQSRAIANEWYQYLLAVIGLMLLALAIVVTFYVRKAIAAEYAARQELKRFAMTDPLTGLSNRRAFMEAAERSLARVQDDPERNLSLAIFDIDHFKRINDRFGHPSGDAVIKDVGRRAEAALRQRDLVGRIGGEEFGVVLPGADLETARAVCERLREAIAGKPVVHGDAIVAFTASIGVAEYQDGDDLDHLMARADAALYEAKTGGRNRVCLAA